MLVALVWLAERLPSEPASSSSDATHGWRRTNHGWQRLESLHRPASSEPPSLHPAIVGGLEILLTLTALVAFSAGDPAAESRRGDEKPLHQSTMRVTPSVRGGSE